jgi:hypothetical protein
MSEDVYDEEGKPGFTLRCYHDEDKSTPPNIFNLNNARYQKLDLIRDAALTAMGTFKPIITGSDYLSFSTFGNTTVYINGEIVFKVVGQSANPIAFLMGCATEQQKQYHFDAGQEYQICIESTEVCDTCSGLSLFHRVNGFGLDMRIFSNDLNFKVYHISSIIFNARKV